MNRVLAVILPAVLVISLPLLFMAGTIRVLLATDVVLRVEYSRPDFTPAGYRVAPDTPAWTAAERLRYGTATLLWLRDGQPAAELAALIQENGTLLYRQDEVGHMEDVQNLTNGISRLLVITSLAAGLSGVALAKRRSWTSLGSALVSGGVLAWLIIGVLAIMLLGGIGSSAWATLFVGFHRVFFPQGNWQFAYSDSLIRLFPEQLWFDVGAVILGTPLMLAAVSGIMGWRWRRGALEAANATSVAPPAPVG